MLSVCLHTGLEVLRLLSGQWKLMYCILSCLYVKHLGGCFWKLGHEDKLERLHILLDFYGFGFLMIISVHIFCQAEKVFFFSMITITKHYFRRKLEIILGYFFFRVYQFLDNFVFVNTWEFLLLLMFEIHWLCYVCYSICETTQSLYFCI
jgi:hypothetical protein